MSYPPPPPLTHIKPFGSHFSPGAIPHNFQACVNITLLWCGHVSLFYLIGPCPSQQFHKDIMAIWKSVSSGVSSLNQELYKSLFLKKACLLFFFLLLSLCLFAVIYPCIVIPSICVFLLGHWVIPPICFPKSVIWFYLHWYRKKKKHKNKRIISHLLYSVCICERVREPVRKDFVMDCM